MSEADQDPTCENCGEPRRKLDMGDARMADPWVCVNQDCPESGSDMALMADPEAGARSTRPGSMGGDNGGG